MAQLVSPAIIRFEASDADGPGPGVKSYRYLLIRDDDPLFVPALTDPDSLRRKFAPNFAGWTELKGTATDVTLSGLLPNRSYVFALTAFDRRKNYDAVFTLTRNVLFFVFVDLASPARGTTSAL